MAVEDPKELMLVRHIKSKGIYTIIAVGEMKIADKWYPSVSYEAVGKVNPIHYTRLKEEFMRDFDVVPV